MFMRENRKKNGAPQPEQTAAQDTPKQAAARKLSPNLPVDGKADDWRFSPELSTPQQINRAHYQGGVSGAGPYATTYEQHIPFIGGPEYESGKQPLGSEP